MLGSFNSIKICDSNESEIYLFYAITKLKISLNVSIGTSFK